MFLKMTNIIVAMAAPAPVKSKARKVRMVIGSDLPKIRFALCDHRGFLENPRGARKMHRKVKQVPTMKQANIHVLAVCTRLKAETTFVGKAILAPESSSLRIIWTGLNQ